MKRTHCIAIAALALGVLAAVSSVQAQTKKVSYAITELPLLASSDTSAADSINNSGQIVGRGYPTGDERWHTCIWEKVDGQWTVRDVGSYEYYDHADAGKINDLGQVTGFTQMDAPRRAFFYDDLIGFETLPTLEGLDTFAYALNNLGMICGSSANGDLQNATLWEAGDGGAWTVTSLAEVFAPLRGIYSYLMDINDAQQIVGNSRSNASSTDYRAHVWERNVVGEWTMTDLSGNLPLAGAINEVGQIAGTHAVNGTRHACVWNPVDGTWSLTDLSAFATEFTKTTAEDLNDWGQIVGRGWLASGSVVPYLYVGGSMQNLNVFLPNGSGWSLASGYGINNQGQVIGNGYSPSGSYRAFLMDTRAVTYSYTSTGSAVSIKDKSTASKAMTLTDNVTITDLNVKVTLYHTRYTDLQFDLVGPNNVTRRLCNAGAVTGSGTKTLVFDDEGAVGAIVPVNPLSYYDGTSTVGKWTLKITDTVKNLKTGSFTSFTLDVMPQL
jgi:subtilisin-like proprotein convertase family protein